MQVSVKGRYGLEAMVCLALFSSQERVRISRIAQVTGISENYLEQLFGTLRRQGLVRSVRGAQGGYHLGEGGLQITAGAILRALEGPLVPVACVAPEAPTRCDRWAICATKSIWAAMGNRLGEIVDHVTLADLLASYHQECDARQGNASPEYTI